MHIVAGGSLYRLHLGPYRAPEAARAMSDRIQSELNLRPVIVSR
jgi:cell division protein FtsN